MKKYDIDIKSILSKGHVVTDVKSEMLYITTTRRLSTNFEKENMALDSYVYIPGTFKLPLRIDISVKIDSPGLYLLLGNGHINFGTPWSDNRRIDDIVAPNCKPRFFYNHIPMNEFVDISVIYGLDAMQILVNGEERFYSEKEKYMKSKLLKELNSIGFTLRISCTKRTNLLVKSLSITEYDEAPPIVRSNSDLPKPLTSNEAVEVGQKPKFESCISLLPNEIRNEIIKMDSFLRSLRPFKFKRQIEKYGNKITYLASDYGFSYALYPSNDVMHHSLCWYIITNSKPEFWHRKADMMEETLKKLDETSPEFAERMFSNLTECIACRPCSVKTLYEFNGKKKLVCHGIMEFKMCVSDFEGVRTFINTVNDLASIK
ncbi:hypothetical protein [Clostridium sp. BNL1100]|uniref:hypothetical protein n=1 Tax=Clostridium sp. BNL1100 TaxID=755731 RepID=UPI000306E20B|nr:hypothetical protein [Clostridium sp. BNL1100]